MRRFGWVIGLALLCGLGGTARAQYSPEMDLSRYWDVRIGFFVPERGVSREKGGDIWFTLGAERRIYEAERWTGTVSVDYYGAGGIYNIPITLNARGTTHRLRYGAGAGVGFGHAVGRGATSFSYNLMLGYVIREGPNPVTADVRYLGTGENAGQLNGWAFTVGYSY